LRTPAAQEFLESLIFWDAKRPVTIEIIQRLDLTALARALGVEVPAPPRLTIPTPAFIQPALF
jgi:hypothetical protein